MRSSSAAWAVSWTRLAPPRREPDHPGSEALPWLVPKVRPRFVYEALRLRTGRPGPEFRPLAGHLRREPGGGPARPGAGCGRRRTGPVERRLRPADAEGPHQPAGPGRRGGLPASSGPGRFRSTWQDNLDGSRMLLPGVLQRLPLPGDPVVVLPNRDTLLVVGSEDPAGLRWALEGALEFLDEDPALPERLPPAPAQLPVGALPPREEHPVHPLLGRVHNGGSGGVQAARRPCWTAATAPGQGHHPGPVPAGADCRRPARQLHRLVPGHGRSLAARGRPGAAVLGTGAGSAAGPGCPGAGCRPACMLEPVGLFPERYRFREHARPEPAGKPPGLTHAGSSSAS